MNPAWTSRPACWIFRVRDQVAVLVLAFAALGNTVRRSMPTNTWSNPARPAHQLVVVSELIDTSV
jgi:hypothetical protein